MVLCELLSDLQPGGCTTQEGEIHSPQRCGAGSLTKCDLVTKPL
jgi:hypothetical protein